MAEKIGIREAARRLGVSDTAVRKAIASGRIVVAGRTKTSDRPLLDWEDTKRRWIANSDTTKRSHVGSRGSERRERYAAGGAEVQLPTSNNLDQQPDDMGADAPRSGRGGSYAQARAAREVYQAKLAKLEFEQRSGKLIDADEVKIAWHKHIVAAKTRIMGIPAKCKTRHADLPLAVVAIIEQVCREALEDLANARE